MSKVNVGIGKVGSGGAGDVLTTSGLANCIAIVAYDKKSEKAAMYHYMTHTTFKSDNTVKPAEMSKAKALVDSALKKAGGKPSKYFVSIGGLWKDAKGSVDEMRHNLLMAIVKNFKMEPKKAGKSATFDISAGKLSVSG